MPSGATLSSILRWQHPIAMEDPNWHGSQMLPHRVRMEAGRFGEGQRTSRRGGEPSCASRWSEVSLVRRPDPKPFLGGKPREVKARLPLVGVRQ